MLRMCSDCKRTVVGSFSAEAAVIMHNYSREKTDIATCTCACSSVSLHWQISAQASLLILHIYV